MLKDLFSLQGRVALVTGGSRGIGRMIAEGFLTQGARVYISARKAAACDQTAAELSALGTCISLPADVSTVQGARALAAAVAQREEHLDILVNNAGAAWGAPLAEFPEGGWDKVVDLNMKAPFFLTQALLPLLARGAQRQMAKVINIASIDGVSVNPWETYSYQASKAGLIHLTRCMAVGLAPDVLVNCVAPGYIEDTRATANLDSAYRQRSRDGALLKRAADKDDVADQVVAFCRTDSITGQTLAIDAGRVFH